MDKRALVDQLVAKLREALRIARVAIEWSNLARGHARRAQQAQADVTALESFALRPFARNAPVDVGAVVEVEHQDGGLTFFLAPGGAGEELTGPGGDGFLTVVTPHSPLGRAVLGKCAGDTVEARIGGELREWTITWVE